MPDTLRSPTLSSHKPVPYTVICHKEEEEDDWSDDNGEEENARKNLINVKEEKVFVNGNGLERTGMADCNKKQDIDKVKKQNEIFLKNGVRLHHQRRTMEVKEVQEKQEKQRQGAETVL